MDLRKRYFMSLLGLLFAFSAQAHVSPLNNSPNSANDTSGSNTSEAATFRFNCVKPEAQIDQDINNVRARLTTGGDVWWDRNDGKYVVPKPLEAGDTEVSSIFAGGVWLGGFQEEVPRVAAQQYGNAGSNSRDFWTGPLNPSEDPTLRGTTADSICEKWDRFWVVTGQEIDEHIANFNDARDNGTEYDPADIPLGVKGWPGRGNPFFQDINNFALPNTTQGLGAFFDQDGDELYNPANGDFPIVEIEGCEDAPPQYPDQMFFWIYNDAGNIHTESDGAAIRMEIQVQSFAYTTNDALNDMTFQRYKLINRASNPITETFFAMWVDADLGCYTDDYIGCDTIRELAYYYNVDEEDGTTGTICEGGVPTYGNTIPALGVDYFRGPKSPIFEEGTSNVIGEDTLGMSSFVYFNNPGPGDPPTAETDPSNVVEYYNYLSGFWRDGTPFTEGGNGYGGTTPVPYVFPDPPNDTDGWSMCTAASVNNPDYDRRTVQASGPFTLLPGAVNQLIVGAVWVPDMPYPCPDMTRLFNADDLAQNLFDACFMILDGPDAPDIDIIELDREIVLILSNDNNSNNAGLNYEETDINAPGDVDNLYRFEGYKVYQLIDGRISSSEYEDPDKARLVAQVDVKNGITTIYNWKAQDDLPDFIADPVFTAEQRVDGSDNGIRSTFRVTQDLFAGGNDSRLVNHKKYYYSAVAYGYNNWMEFDPVLGEGQRMPYLEGRKNISTYIGIPRPITDVNLNAEYGDGVQVTRLDGVGNGGNFLDLTQETNDAITGSPSFQLDGGRFDAPLVYESGRGPIDVQIYNPLDVKNGTFKLELLDENLEENGDLALWRLTGDNFSDVSEQTLDFVNEQVVGEYGFSLSIGQVDEPGDQADNDNGAIGYEEDYVPGGAGDWYTGIPNRGGEFLNGQEFLGQFLVFANEERVSDFDPRRSLLNIGGGFYPYKLGEFRTGDYPAGNNSPVWQNNNNNLVSGSQELADLNNVDIVMTSNKDLWSRCVIVETSTPFISNNLHTVGDADHFDPRQSPSVTKNDNDGDGRPDVDPDPEFENGMGWFPGYAIDVETGQRLNIFFGENSSYRCEPAICDFFEDSNPTGADMMYNPTSQFFSGFGGGNISSINLVLGGHHHIYVMKSAYDGCAALAEALNGNSLARVGALQEITWTGVNMLNVGSEMRSYADGLIPNDVTMKLRVNNRYDYEEGTTAEPGTAPTYTFTIDGKQATDLDEAGVENQLDMINVVPNPYYGYSDYEGASTETTVKITNLPAKCIVSIYTLDGKFIRRYNRDETGQAPAGSGIAKTQIVPDIDWDLKNNKGIPIAGGLYLIHIDAEGLGERVIKWFGTNRAFDPSNL